MEYSDSVGLTNDYCDTCNQYSAELNVEDGDSYYSCDCCGNIWGGSLDE